MRQAGSNRRLSLGVFPPGVFRLRLNVSTTADPTTQRPVSLGVIFLTLYIDLIGFSIGFPLGPDLLDYYLKLEGHSGALGWLVAQSAAFAHLLGKDENFAAVLFGGAVTSVFSILQFVFAPLWGSLSDRLGRRDVLRWTVAGNALGYLVWVLSGSFWLFVLSRVISGAFSGNLSVATAAVADVTTRQERSKAMGLVGAAFGLGLVTGPTIGALLVRYNLLELYPALGKLGINPFSVPALVALALCLINLVWITARFNETLTAAARAQPREKRERNPLRAILSLDNAAVRRVNFVAFTFSIAFVAMEVSITFLTAQRFGYTARQNGLLLGFLGVCSIITQGYIVRKILKPANETRVLAAGLALSGVGLLIVGFAGQPWVIYTGLAVLACGAGLVNPSSTGLISLYSGANEQGRVLGVFRSLGSLSRAFTPILAGAVFWLFGAHALFVASAILAGIAFALCRSLPEPET
ncbi:MAG: MFS transporter [Verrucomicrobia bacterium]|nr:MFS transporter [Verrucomicrobiota bacterium]